MAPEPTPAHRPAPATLADFLQQAREAGLDRLDAQLIACTALGVSRSWLLAHDTDALPPEHLPRLMDWLRRRAEGEPLAYLVGDKAFFGLTLSVSPHVLIPRPDTETLVEWALQALAGLRAPRVVDLGTGSGAIALAIASQRPDADVTAVDFSPPALAVAQANAQRLGLSHVRFLAGSWLSPLAGERFDLIVSNPPYIAEGDAHLPALRHEPRSALTSGPDGLDDLRQIAQQAPGHIHENGWLLLEHGFDQAEAVQHLLQDAGFTDVSTRFDLGPQARCTGGRWPGAHRG
ncbi:MAG: peptide chain release factor N(5)-glutamine methyltransferase [Burkholderiales bacterium]|nr:peptide chain release factor N(5)-glutamine methyltransferase [Burkholderiales bacterium]MBH2017774.1 peptide chain release factor N(5)-glutamine methyltransferase [Burkholderiales bacterium]